VRLLFLPFVLAAAFAVPMAAFANDAPSPAVVAACQAEAAQLGKDAFVAKYGPSEPFGHCYASHTTTTDDPATAACKAEYLKLGPDAFKAKYGATDPLAACLAAPSKGLAQALCSADAKALGKSAFVAKYGKEAFGQCVKNTLAKARQIVAACKSSSASSKDAFKACLANAVPKRR
jgi:hypothetical protein